MNFNMQNQLEGKFEKGKKHKKKTQTLTYSILFMIVILTVLKYTMINIHYKIFEIMNL